MTAFSLGTVDLSQRVRMFRSFLQRLLESGFHVRSHAGSHDYKYVLDCNLVPRVSLDSENEAALTVGRFNLEVIRKVPFLKRDQR